MRASAFFQRQKVLALAIHFGTFYIFSAVRQLGSIYSALSLSRQPLLCDSTKIALTMKFEIIYIFMYTKLSHRKPANF